MIWHARMIWHAKPELLFLLQVVSFFLTNDNLCFLLKQRWATLLSFSDLVLTPTFHVHLMILIALRNHPC
jgi:hypothetical protein